MTTLFTHTLSAAGLSNEFALQPGQSVTYLASTANLANATLSLEQSANGTVWERARDQAQVLVPNAVGTAGVVTATAILRNERTEATRYRAVLTATGIVAGSIVVTFTSAADASTIDKVAIITDEGIEFLVPINAPGIGSGVLSVVQTVSLTLSTPVTVPAVGVEVCVTPVLDVLEGDLLYCQGYVLGQTGASTTLVSFDVARIDGTAQCWFGPPGLVAFIGQTHRILANDFWEWNAAGIMRVANDGTIRIGNLLLSYDVDSELSTAALEVLILRQS